MIEGDFLDWVVTTPEGWFQLLIGPTDAGFVEEWYKWPADKARIITRVNQVNNTNVYFSPHLFDAQRSTKEHVLPSRTLCVDLDNADVTDLRMNPTVMVETSPGRHQGFWVLKAPPSDFESLSKKLSYTIENADHSGWPLGHKFRVPDTRNYKYNPSPIVRLVHALSSERIYAEDEIVDWTASTDTAALAAAGADDNWINNPPTTHAVGPLELLEKYRANLGPKVLGYYNNVQSDRSEALWALMVAMFRAGATRDETYWVAYNSANNKFKDHRYNGERDLAKDVDRAFKAESSDRSDVSQMVKIAERSAGTPNDRKRLVTRIVVSDMLRRGEFIYTDDGRYWYLHSNAGKPIQLGRRSDQLNGLLDASYGLNPHDGFHPYVCDHLVNHTINKGRHSRGAVLSHYDGSSLLLHSGRQDVYRITSTSVTRHPDGQFGVLFPWRPQSEEVILLDEPISDDWASWVLEGWFDNLLDFTAEQATLMIRIWVLFILFRDAAVSRPILAMLGQQGSGKSTLFHLLYTIFYGKGKSLNAISSIEDFDYLTASDPLVVFDNVDSWTGWLPDRLALAAASSDLVKRKLYTDSDTVTLRRQAILGITAHEPKFGRPDVVDRLIILNFQRRQTFAPESAMTDRIQLARARIWGSIVKDIQAVLSTPDVSPEEVPNFRISDFARVGARIARAFGRYSDFVTIVEKLRRSQVAFTLSEDDVLIDGLKRWMSLRNGSTPDYVSVGYLWEYISNLDRTFAISYKTSAALGRKLITMEPNLKVLFSVENQYDNIRGVRTWKIGPKT